MADSPDLLFLKLAVSRGLVDQALAKDLFQEAGAVKKPVSELLVTRGVMTAYTVEQLNRELAKAQAPKVIAGFQVMSKLGQGGMGAVYRATQVSIGREVALKVMAPEVARNKGFAERFLREGMAMGAINHPNVVTCFDAGQDGKILYMAMELMTGGDADQLARERGGILPPLRACAIVRDCAAGLGAIHRAGLIHRDIKPANIFLTEEGTAKLADLGLARQEDGDDKMTHTGTAMGTPAFMSPEQAEGVDDLDIRSDIYALGATLFTLVTGQPPFTGASAFAVVAKVINDPVPDPRGLNPNVPDALAQLIRTAMHKDRRKRFPTPQDLHAALNGCINELSAAGLTAETVGALPPGLTGQQHPTPLTHVGPGNSHRHRSHSTIAPQRNWLVGTLVFAGIATAAVIGIMVANDKPVVQLKPEPMSTAPVAPTKPVEPAPAKPSDPVTDLKPGAAWPDRAAWAEAVGKLPLTRRLELVAAALAQLNPNHDGRFKPTLDVAHDDVPEIAIAGGDLHDLRPLTAFRGLRTLVLTRSTPNPLPFYQLDQLLELPLVQLGLGGCMIESVAPLAGKPLSDLDISDSLVTDIAPVLQPALRRLAFNTAHVTGGLDALRGLKEVESIGPTWSARVPPAEFWHGYDTGAYPLPGGRAPKLAPPPDKPTRTPAVEPAPVAQAPVQAPADPVPAPAAPAKPAPPATLTLRPLTIPDNAATKVRDAGRGFNDTVNRITTVLAQKRKEASRTLAKTLDSDFKREMALGLKNSSRLPIADAVRLARDALAEGAGTRDAVFADPNLPPTTVQALADWRGGVEPLEAEAASQGEDRRQASLVELKALAEDGKAGAAELVAQLQGMAPSAPAAAADVEPLPVEGCVWRTSCMTALPHDTLLRDLTGIHGPARVVGELVETDVGKALRGDGRTTQISVTLKRPLAARTLMAWVSPSYDQQVNGGVIGLQSPDGARYEAIVHGGVDNGWCMQNELKRSPSSEFGSGAGRWTHLALVVDGADRTLYVDGRAATSDRSAAPPFPAGSEIVVGKRNSSREQGRVFAGLIDGCLIFDRALGQKEVRAVRDFQSRGAWQVHESVRAREWVPVPLANADFTRVTGGRFSDWAGRLDGVSQGGEGLERWLRLELTRAGQEARTLRQPIRLDPLWRSLRLAYRMRWPKALDALPGSDYPPFAGLNLVLVDPSGAQPEVRRWLGPTKDMRPAEWIEMSDDSGWPIPPGYTQGAVECVLRWSTGCAEIDDVRVQALVGKP